MIPAALLVILPVIVVPRISMPLPLLEAKALIVPVLMMEPSSIEPDRAIPTALVAPEEAPIALAEIVPAFSIFPVMDELLKKIPFACLPMPEIVPAASLMMLPVMEDEVLNAIPLALKPVPVMVPLLVMLPVSAEVKSK